MLTGELCPIQKSRPVMVAGGRMPSQLVHKCRTKNSNNRRSECKVKADALHDRYGARMERSTKQRNARKAKRAARMN